MWNRGGVGEGFILGTDCLYSLERRLRGTTVGRSRRDDDDVDWTAADVAMIAMMRAGDEKGGRHGGVASVRQLPSIF